MIFNTWLTEKPDIDQECLLIVGDNFDGYCTLYNIKKTEYDGKWYFGVFDGYGDEWGDIAYLTADKYYVMKPLK